MILAPLLLVYAVLVFLENMFSIASLSIIFHTVGSLALGLSALFLLSFILVKRSRFTTFLFAAGIMAVAGFEAVFSYTGMNLSGDLYRSFILYGIGMFVLLFGMCMAMHTIRNNYSLKRFRSWLPVWIVVLTVFMGFASLIVSGSIRYMRMIEILLLSLVQYGIMGLFLYVILLLPFFILLYNNSLYRARFNSAFGVEEGK